MSKSITLFESLLVSIVSMAVVFIVLLLISFLITGLKATGKEKIVVEKRKDERETVVSDFDRIEAKDSIDEELVAVISCAIACCLDTNIPNLKIKKITRISDKQSIWSETNTLEQIQNY